MCWWLVDVAFCVHVTDPGNVNYMKSFLKSVVGRLAIDTYNPGQTKMVRVAMVNYWHQNNTNIPGYNTWFTFNHKRYGSQAEVVSFIDDFQFTTGSSGDLSQCFAALNNDIMKYTGGERFYAEPFVFIITDDEIDPVPPVRTLVDRTMNGFSSLPMAAMQISNTPGGGKNCKVLSDVLAYSGNQTMTSTCDQINAFSWTTLNSPHNVDWAVQHICPNDKDGDFDLYKYLHSCNPYSWFLHIPNQDTIPLLFNSAILWLWASQVWWV